MTEIISEDYRKLNAQLHAENDKYGVSGHNYRHLIRPLADWGREPILDFGAGKCTLSKCLGPAYRCTDYDPCVAGLDKEPEPHSVVVCTDVLEHIEPEYLDRVLAELRRLTERKLFVSIAIGPSSKHLADGRNSHLIQQKPEWWGEKLKGAGFKIVKQKPADQVANLVWYICE